MVAADAPRFPFDILISHHPDDAARARKLAKGLRTRNRVLRVVLTSEAASTAVELRSALDRARALILLVSRSGGGSPLLSPGEQARSFLDPNDPDRRFGLVRLDEVRLDEALDGITSFDFRTSWDSREVDRLHGLISPPARAMSAGSTRRLQAVLRGHSRTITGVALSADGRRAVSGAVDGMLHVWDVEARTGLATLGGHDGEVTSVALSADGRRALSGLSSGLVQVWDVKRRLCLASLEGHLGFVTGVALSADGRRAVSGADDGTVRVWDVDGDGCLASLEGYESSVNCVALSGDGRRALSGSRVGTIQVWDVKHRLCLASLEGHRTSVNAVALSSDGRRAVSGGSDGTVRVWDVAGHSCLAMLEGHAGEVDSVSLSADGCRALSGSRDGAIRVWDVDGRSCLAILEGHTGSILGVSLSTDGLLAVSGGADGIVRVWDLSNLDADLAPATAIYTSAKVLLTGESGVGKSGLVHRMVQERFTPTISTDACWATILPLPQAAELPEGVEREVWLWDFAGQADYRLIHQLYMDGTDVALLVFNPQDDDPYEGLAEWDRAISRAAGGRPFVKLLVAGRVDRGGLRVSGEAMKTFAAQRGFQGYHETSAVTGRGCAALRQAILDAIPWDRLPATASPRTFRRIKEEVIKLKDAGKRILLRMGELESALNARMPGDPFTPDELATVVRLLAAAGVTWLLPYEERPTELDARPANVPERIPPSFEWVLLQPERINSYAAAVVREVKKHPLEIGCITEDAAMAAQYQVPPETKLPRAEEEVVLREMLRMMIARGICLREHTPRGTQLVFPAYFRRERPTLPENPPAFVSYRFRGILDEVYTTLVVRLHHTEAFDRDALYKDAADFRTPGSNRHAGVRLARLPDSQGELTVYLDPAIPIEVKVIFMQFVDDHLHAAHRATDVVRTRYYACHACGTPVESHDNVRKKLREGKRSIRCVECDEYVDLFDEIEKRFGSPEVRQKARAWEWQAQVEIDTQSKELIMESEVGAIVGLANQIFRPVSKRDEGIDAEIEFTDDEGRGTGRRVYLQLKAGDSHLRPLKKGVEMFDIKDPRWSAYWQQQAYPVMLVVRSSRGVIRWMDVSAVLKQRTRQGETNIRSIEFRAEPLTVEGLLEMRAEALR